MRRTTPVRWLVLSAALFTLAVAPSLASARAWLGVYTQEITAELHESLDLPMEGVLVSSVVSGSPAERAGIRKGDVITEVDNHKVSSPAELSSRIAEGSAGESVSLSIRRNGKSVILAVRLAERPAGDDDTPGVAPVAPIAPKAPKAPHAPGAPHEMRWYSSGDGSVDPDEIRARIHDVMPDLKIERMGPGANMMHMSGGRGRLGVRIETLSDDLAQALGAPGARGALVVEVFDGTAAEKAGLRAGDVITTVDGTSVADGDELVRALRDKEGKVSLSVVRRGEKRTLTAELDDSPRVIRLRDGVVEKSYGGPGDEKKIRIHVDDGDDDNADLRKQLDDLRQQLQELREELKKNRK